MSQIEPAITQDELLAAQFLVEKDFQLINNVDTYSSFRSHEWILYYANGNRDNTHNTLSESDLNHEYLMIQDASILSDEEKKLLNNKTPVLTQGVVAIYKTK